MLVPQWYRRKIRFEVSTPLRPACVRIPQAHEALEPGGATRTPTDSDGFPWSAWGFEKGSAIFQGWVNSAEFTCETKWSCWSFRSQTFSNYSHLPNFTMLNFIFHGLQLINIHYLLHDWRASGKPAMAGAD